MNVSNKYMGAAVGVTLIFLSSYSYLYYKGTADYYTEKNIISKNIILESENGIYFGDVVNLSYNGNGIFKYLDDGIYEGEFSESKRDGTGEFRWSNGDVYIGTWSSDNLKSGKYVYSDGRIYEGDFENNKLLTGYFDLGDAAANYGYNTLRMDIKDGVPKKICYKKINGESYNGAVDGYTEIIYLNGNKYVGNVTNGIRNGNGTFKWISNGIEVASYVGSWKNNQMEGYGSYYYTNEKYPYIEGQFSMGKPFGQLTYYLNEKKSFKTRWEKGKCVNSNI